MSVPLIVFVIAILASLAFRKQSKLALFALVVSLVALFIALPHLPTALWNLGVNAWEALGQFWSQATRDVR